MTGNRSEAASSPTPDSLNLGAVQIVDIVSSVVQELDELDHRVRMVMERAPTLIADSEKLADVTTSLLRSALESAPPDGPIEVEVAARCLAQSHETMADGGKRQECQALVSVAIRDQGREAERPASNPRSKISPDLETSLMNAQKIVQLHKGKLWVTNRPEHGRTLGFCLTSERVA